MAASVFLSTQVLFVWLSGINLIFLKPIEPGKPCQQICAVTIPYCCSPTEMCVL